MIVHGHFYQPPRENPWTGAIDHQPTAAPFHDWNERVHAESYLPNSEANIVDAAGERTVNNYERMSFDVGPTLFSWLADVHPKTYGRILEADRASARRLGRGNAIAQGFHHAILPLSSDHDLRTEVRWGLADFRHRFGREAEGMWLPETAASDKVLGVLVEEGVDFTILAPWQAARWRPQGGNWIEAGEAGLDTRLPYRWEHPDGSGRSLALFFYDGEIARSIAFEKATSSAEGLIDLFVRRGGGDGTVVTAATDGETYGHHHIFGEIGLAYALFVEAERRGLQTTNYAAFLERFPPRRAVQLPAGEGTSWSCAHGVGRWQEDCGCHTGGEPGWNQAWRAPLRKGLEVLKGAADAAFERAGRELVTDPWAARDDYVSVVIGAATWDHFLRRWGARLLQDGERARARLLFEMQRSALAMFTSCAWFFSDISGIETVQILRYAARTIELLEDLEQWVPTQAFLAELEQAKSNIPAFGTGADIFSAEWARTRSRSARL
jgi:alpha-amylase/alpha-mannosidase (GH57 family)